MKTFTLTLTLDERHKLLNLVQARILAYRRSIKEHRGENHRTATIAGQAKAALPQWEAIEEKLVLTPPIAPDTTDNASVAPQGTGVKRDV